MAERDSMIFYRSFYESIKELPEEVQSKVYSSIFEYSLNFNEVALEGLPKTIFTLIKPQLDANNKRYENGTKGGRKKQEETKTEPKQNQTETKTEANKNKNVNKNNNVNEISNPSDARDGGSNVNVDFQKFVDAFNAIANRSFRVNDKIKSSLKARLKDYSKTEILEAVKKAHKDQYHIDTNFKYLTPEFILRPDKLEKFLNAPEENQVVSKPNIEPEYFSRSERAEKKRNERKQ